MFRSRCLTLLTAGLALAIQACASTSAEAPAPLATERAALKTRLELADGNCRVYADYGSIPNSATFFEVLRAGEPASNNSVVIADGKLIGRLNFMPVELAIDGDHVVGSFAAQPVRFAIDRGGEQTTVRLSPTWHLIAGQGRVALQSPSTSFEATAAGDGLLAGAVRTRDQLGKVEIRLANCDLAFLRDRPDLLVLLFGAFEGSLARSELAADARTDAEYARR